MNSLEIRELIRQYLNNNLEIKIHSYYSTSRMEDVVEVVLSLDGEEISSSVDSLSI